MKKIVDVLFLFVFSFTANAQVGSAKSLLWEISGNGLAQPSYLYGTMHLIPEKDFILSPTLKKKFKECKVLALETQVDFSFKEQMNMAYRLIIPGGKTIRNYLPPSSYDTLYSYMKDSLHFSENKIEDYTRLKPFFLGAILLDAKYRNMASFEKTFMKMGRKNKMSFSPLESIEYGLTVVDSFSLKDQAEALVQDLYTRNDLDTIVQLYKSQDIEALYKYINATENDIPGAEEILLVHRNQNWIPVIEKLVYSQGTFIAVGAGHLPGPNGLISMLQKKGYTVTPVIQ